MNQFANLLHGAGILLLALLKRFIFTTFLTTGIGVLIALCRQKIGVLYFQKILY
jgi:hypothetical protein